MKRINLIFSLFAVFTSITCAQNSENDTTNRNIPGLQVDTITIVTQRAESGDDVSQNTLGEWYYNGYESISIDYNKAVEWWKKSAKKNNAQAIGNLALCYQLGHGVQADSIQAAKLYKSALQLGNRSIIPLQEKIAIEDQSLFSALLLQDIYRNGIGTRQNFAKASEYVKLAAEYGHQESIYLYGVELFNTNQFDKSVVWLKKSADTGNTMAEYLYGLQLFEGKGVAQDKATALKYISKAAEKGNIPADYQLGRIYLEADGVEQNLEKAVYFLEKVALEDNRAAWLLGKCYKDGIGMGQDFYMATQLISKSLDNGSESKKRIQKLLEEDNNGTYTQYLRGLYCYFIDKNYDDALKYFNIVKKAGNVEGLTMAAMCYANSNYIKHNEKKAAKMLIKAAQSSSEAKYYLSALYATGTGVDKNETKAVELLEEAANEGLAYAQCRLGDRYFNGDAVVRDYTKATTLYLKAEKWNLLTTGAAQNLSKCYEMKIANLPDLEEAEYRVNYLNHYTENNKLNILLSNTGFSDVNIEPIILW